MVSFRSNNISKVNFLPENLEWLILTNNSINKICNIGKLVNLKKLMLSGNMLNTLPKDIVNCQKIELLRLSNNQFSRVPEYIFELNNLEVNKNSCKIFFSEAKQKNFSSK